MLLSLTIVNFIILSVIESALSIESCEFCVDRETSCEDDWHTSYPMEMNCRTFLVNGKTPTDFVVEPLYFKDLELILKVSRSLGKRKLKTVCVSIQYSRMHLGVEEKFVFKSCGYGDEVIGDVNNSCEAFSKSIDEKFNFNREFQTMGCSLNAGPHLLNSDIKPSLNVVIVFVIFVVFIFILPMFR